MPGHPRITEHEFDRHVRLPAGLREAHALDGDSAAVRRERSKGDALRCPEQQRIRPLTGAVQGLREGVGPGDERVDGGAVPVGEPDLEEVHLVGGRLIAVHDGAEVLLVGRGEEHLAIGERDEDGLLHRDLVALDLPLERSRGRAASDSQPGHAARDGTDHSHGVPPDGVRKELYPRGGRAGEPSASPLRGTPRAVSAASGRQPGRYATPRATTAPPMTARIRSTAKWSSSAWATGPSERMRSTAVQTQAGRRPSTSPRPAHAEQVSARAGRKAQVPWSPRATAPTLATPPMAVAVKRTRLFRRVATGSGWSTRMAEMTAHSVERCVQRAKRPASTAVNTSRAS